MFPRCYMPSDVFSKLKYSTTHYCVTRHERVELNSIYEMYMCVCVCVCVCFAYVTYIANIETSTLQKRLVVVSTRSFIHHIRSNCKQLGGNVSSYFLDILKRSLQNFQKILKKVFPSLPFACLYICNGSKSSTRLCLKGRFNVAS